MTYINLNFIVIAIKLKKSPQKSFIYSYFATFKLFAK